MSTNLDALPRSHTIPGAGARRWLAALLGMLAIGAFQGGLTMVRDPIAPLGLQVEFLERTPIDTYFWPGVFLLSIGAACQVTVIGLMSHWQWRWATGIERRVGYRWPLIGAFSVGATLLAFELIEVYLVPFHPLMHPLLIAASVAVLLLASTSSTRTHFRADRLTDLR